MYFDWLFFIDKCGFYFNLYHMVKYHEIIVFKLI